jgi:asparagine synthase (glutamine-hydrolysing)
MCGLAGFIGRGDRDDLGAMIGAMRHRGPDGEGEFVDASTGVHLGHLRLAILDFAGGVQPMWNEDETVCVVYNGEIYNHAELRRGLEARGHVFRSDHSDTEVLVHGYEEWGQDLPAKLNGMFAFAIFDRLERRLFLARDRFGEKPLYYAEQNGMFAFASELSAIAQHRSFNATVDRRSLQKFLAYGFLPSPNAYLENARKLPGGCLLIYCLDKREARVSRYWRFRLSPDEGLETRPEGELIEELRALLSEAVRRRLLSDVPLGLFLSGGLDSSAVLWGAARNIAADRIRTFTVGFSEASFDESEHAATVAATFGAQHQAERLDLDAARDLIPDVLSRLDEPLGDASILPTFMLSRFTRRHVRVALSGDGGDELFAGYDPFVALPWARLYHSSMPQPLHRFVRNAVGMLPISPRNMSLDFKLRRTLVGLSYRPEIWNPVWLSPADPALIADLFEQPISAEELYSEAIALWTSGEGKSDVERTLEFYTNFYLQDGILTKVDRAAMMCSLESRAVFLDNDLVDFCQRLPTRFKYRQRQRKYLLRRALEGVLPAQIVARPKKGFGIPLAKWLRSVPVIPPLGALPGVRLDRVANAWNEHRSGRADHRLLLWSWLSLQHTRAAGVG